MFPIVHAAADDDRRGTADDGGVGDGARRAHGVAEAHAQDRTPDVRPHSPVADRVTLAARGLVIAAIFAPFWFWSGGLVEIEALQFIPQYLDERPLLQKVFDPHANDFGTYQARELSYFLDAMDAHVFKRLIASDIVVFVPLTALAASVLTAVVFFIAVRRYRVLRPLTATLLLLVYLTNYIHLVTMGMFYRATKPLLAPVLMATAFYVLALLDPARGADGWMGRRRAPAVMFVLCCVMSLLDRQGFFYAILALAVLLVHAVLARRRWDVAGAAAAAVGCMVAYNLALGPWIVERVNGYTPSFAYQQLPLREVVTNPDYARRAGELLGQAAAVFAGSVPWWMAAGALGLLAVVALRSATNRLQAVLILGGVAAGHLAMFAAMVARHPPIYEWLDHRLWYYPLPFQALLVVAIAAGLEAVGSAGKPVRVVTLNALLIVLIIGNVTRWDDHLRTMWRSRWFPTVYLQTHLLKSSFHEGRPAGGLNGEYFGFYRFCLTVSPPLRNRAAGAAAVGGAPR